MLCAEDDVLPATNCWCSEPFHTQTDRQTLLCSPSWDTPPSRSWMCPPVTGGAGHGGIWAVPPATIFLCSFGSMQRSILYHHLSVHSRAIKQTYYTSFACILQYAIKMSQAAKEKPTVTNLVFNMKFLRKLSKQ